MAILFSDNFNGVSGWALETYNFTWTPLGASSAVITPQGRLRSALSGPATALYGYADAATKIPDCLVTCDLYTATTNNTDAAGVVCRLAGDGSCYHARYNRVSGALELYKFIGGAATLLDSVSIAAPAAGSTRRLGIRAVSTNISLLMDGVDMLSVSDNSLADGFGGIRMYTGTGASNSSGIHIDNYQMETAEPPEPTTNIPAVQHHRKQQGIG